MAFADFFPATPTENTSNLGIMSACAVWKKPEQNGFSNTQSNQPDFTLEGMTVNADSLSVHTNLADSPFSSATDLVEATDITGEANPYRECVLSQSEDNGRAAEIVAYSFSFANNGDTDYLAFGSWFYDDDGIFEYRNTTGVFGAFGGISDTDSNSLRTPSSFINQVSSAEARYQSDAVGHYFNNLTGQKLIAFHGALALTAVFNNAPEVSGTISDITYAGITGDHPVAETIMLNPTPVNASTASFIGKTQATISHRNHVGNYGGQLYGDEAQAVVGTFGITVLPFFIHSYIGSFGAKKQPDTP